MKALVLLLALFATPAAAQGFVLPVHGNWCGPGWGRGPALDALDAACMRHDFCVSQMGSQSCTCDIAFMNELRATPWPNQGMAEKARSLYEAIGFVPCDNPMGQATKMAMCAEDWMVGVMNGTDTPWGPMERLSKLAATALGR